MAGYYEKRIDRAFGKAKAINREDHQKLVFFSDCHRGDGSWSDSFLHNKILYQAALDYYWKAGFSYVEVGDGDELWENRSFRRIKEIHGDVFDSLSRFALSGRMFMLAGNHDKVKLKTCAEALVIKNRGEKDIFVIHGHQADFFNDKLWPLARFMVRYLWRPLELSGFKDPTSAARNYRKGSAVENRLISWAKKNDKNIIISPLDDVLRRVHPLQNIHAEEADDGGHNCCEYCGQPSGVCYELAHSHIVSGSKFLRDRNREAAACAGAEADDHKVDGAC